MSWEQIVEALKIFWQQPVPIIGFSVGVVIIGVLRIIAKTSVGKKALNNMQSRMNGLDAQYKKLETLVLEQVEYLKEYYEQALALIEQKKDNTENLLLAIGDNIHNEKVKALIKGYRENMNKSIVIDDIVNTKVGEAKSQLELAKQEYEEAKKVLQEALDNVSKETEKQV